MPELSVVIPTFGRPAKLRACLRRLARQTLSPERYEVLVAIDGPDEASAREAEAAWAGGAARLEVLMGPRAGLNASRNAALARARGRYLVSMNDDVLPEPGFLAAHLEAHREAEGARGPAIVTGYSPFRTFENPTVFDVLARDTSMIFFYDQMVGARARPADHDWGFRHCWGLNFSAPLEPVREVGGFVAVPLLYGYDDIEIAWRLRERFGMPVLFRPGGRAEHDHRYGPREVLERERRLGQAAWRFAGINPRFAAEVFRRDIRSADEVAYSRAFVERERAAAARLESSFMGLADLPASAVGGEHGARLVNLIYEQHLLLKRWYWRCGLVEAAEGEACGAAALEAAASR